MATNYLREWRLHKKLTLEQIASACDSDKSAISRLENGSRRLTLEWMERLARALDVSPNDLLRPPSEYGRKKSAPPAGSVMLADVSGIKSEHLDVVEVKGDGMSPTFGPGDRLIVDKSDTTATNGVFLVDVGSGPEIKRLAPMARVVRLSTDNQTYAPFDVDLKRLRILGRIVARVSRV